MRPKTSLFWSLSLTQAHAPSACYWQGFNNTYWINSQMSLSVGGLIGKKVSCFITSLCFWKCLYKPFSVLIILSSNSSHYIYNSINMIINPPWTLLLSVKIFYWLVKMSFKQVLIYILNSFLCVHVWLYMCSFVHACVQVHMHTCTWVLRPETDVRRLPRFLLI